MLRQVTGFCVVAGLASPAIAQMNAPHESGRKGNHGRGHEISLVGCLEHGALPNSFALNVPDGSGHPPFRHQVGLIGMPRADLQDYVGQQVEVGGKFLPASSSVPDATAEARMTVRYIRQISPSCSPPAHTVATVPVVISARPSAPTAPQSAPAATSTEAASGVNSRAGTTGGLTQTGISGSATLSATPPVIASPTMWPLNVGATTPTRTTPVPATMGIPTVSTFPSPAAGPGFAQGASSTAETTGTLNQTGISGDALLSGLVNVNVQQLLASVQLQATVNVQDVIVNVSDVLNNLQVQALVQALNTNPQASLNANTLTSALQQSGALDPGEWVVGVTGSQIYQNRDLTNALQERGIIQPSETIIGSTGPRVFKARR